MSLLLCRNFFVDKANKGNILSKEEAENLLNGCVKNPKLQQHMKQVAVAAGLHSDPALIKCKPHEKSSGY